MLCSRCASVFDNPEILMGSSLTIESMRRRKIEVDLEFSVHHGHYESLQEALREHCLFCWRLIALFLHPESLFTKSQILFEDGTLMPDVDRAAFAMDYRMTFGTDTKRAISFHSRVRATKDGKAREEKRTLNMFLAVDQQPIESDNCLSTSTGVQSSAMDILSSWISECRTQHKACQRERMPAQDQRFARILDVGDAQDVLIVRLCESDDVPVDAPYLTLSHCWGGAKIPTLTNSNYQEYLTAIPMDGLPQTFTDAIHLARHLKVRYLWIDSLCIIQDSEDDWRTQALLMGEVYKSSFCNIAATGAENPYGGLFVQRNPFSITPLRIAIRISSPEQTETYYDVFDEYDSWTRQILRSKLCKRGWVVQERLLAPRVVHFAKGQLFWECVEKRTSEESVIAGITGVKHKRADLKKWDPLSNSLLQEPYKSDLGVNYIWSSIKAMYGRDSIEFRKDILASDVQALKQATRACYNEDMWTKTHPLILYWAGVVEGYSSNELTRITDRLIALAGVAKILSIRTRIRYVAGHWLYQLPRQLLWMFSGRREVEQTEKYVAPSWSWASVNSGFAISNMKLDLILETKGAMDLIKILDVEFVESRPEESIGRIQSGRLRVRGRLLPIAFDLAAWPGGRVRKNMLIEYWQGSENVQPQGETFILPVLFTRWNERLPTATPNALILESTVTKGTFKRIGTARLSSLYPLDSVVPQLYAANSRYHEDSDDDAVSDNEVETENKLEPTDSALSPQEELHQKKMQSLTSPDMQNAVRTFLRKLDENKSRATSERKPGALALSTVMSLTDRSIDTLPGQRSRNIRRWDEGDKQKIQQAVQHATGPNMQVDVSFRRNMRIRKEEQKLLPKEAVAPHFYLENIEDEESTRLGHFIFDII